MPVHTKYSRFSLSLRNWRIERKCRGKSITIKFMHRRENPSWQNRQTMELIKIMFVIFHLNFHMFTMICFAICLLCCSIGSSVFCLWKSCHGFSWFDSIEIQRTVKSWLFESFAWSIRLISENWAFSWKSSGETAGFPKCIDVNVKDFKWNWFKESTFDYIVHVNSNNIFTTFIWTELQNDGIFLQLKFA